MKETVLYCLAGVGVVLAVILAAILLSGGNDSEEAAADENNIKSSENIDISTGSSRAHALIDEIPGYTVAVLDFTLADMYSPDFNKTQTEISGDDIYAEFTSDSLNGRIRIELTIFNSTEDAQEAWLYFLLNLRTDLAAIISEINSIAVGDIAWGSERQLHFIRGNIKVRMEGFNVSVVEVAQELDAQIIAALEEVAQNALE